MEVILEAVIQGVIGIVAALIITWSTGISQWIVAQAAQKKANTNKEVYETQVWIATEVVRAAEKIFEGLKGQGVEKFAYAFNELKREANELGIPINDSHARALIESAVEGLGKVGTTVEDVLNHRIEFSGPSNTTSEDHIQETL